jgi:vancomycin resistance protein YoaR
MDKKTVTISALLVFAVAVSGFLMFEALTRANHAAAEITIEDYSNPDSIKRLNGGFVQSLSVTINQDNKKLSSKELQSIQSSGGSASLYPNVVSGAINHFYSATGTYHPYSGYAGRQKVRGLSLDKGAGDFLLNLSKSTNRPAKNAELVLDKQAGRATHFVPHQTGQVLLLSNSLQKLNRSLLTQTGGDNKSFLDVHTTEPAIFLSDLNNIGVRELVGQGVSDFSGSSASRIHNIKVGADRYDGLIIAAGEEFSFNKHLGPVDGAHGFLPELVIKAEGTVPEFGGGLCQVSSTAFRAAFFGGLPITQRKNHSYAVSYYRWINEVLPPSEGLDATIYPGVVDLKFQNDTGAAILVDTRVEGNRLYFDFYGTSDNRQVAVQGPITYDRRISGALKAEVSRTVVKAGTETEQTFKSNYVSPNLYPRTYEYAENKEAEQTEQNL